MNGRQNEGTLKRVVHRVNTNKRDKEAEQEQNMKGWERKMERSEYQRKRKRRVGPQSQRDETRLVSEFLFFFSCSCGARINRPKQTSEQLGKFCCWWWMSLHSRFPLPLLVCLYHKGGSLLIKFVLR